MIGVKTKIDIQSIDISRLLENIDSQLIEKKSFYRIVHFFHFMINAERFFKVYVGVPLEERKVPVAVLDNQPINWNLAYEEISNQTKRGEKILKMLIELEIL